MPDIHMNKNRTQNQQEVFSRVEKRRMNSSDLSLKLKNLNKRQKIIMGAGAAFIVCFISTLMMIPLFAEEDMIPLKKDSVNVEYGKVISLEPEEYIDTAQISNDKKEIQSYLKKIDIRCNAKNETFTTKDENGNETESEKDYPATGKYEVTISYTDSDNEKDSKTVAVTVKDTTKPKFTDDFKTSIDIVRDCQPSQEDLANQFKAEDLSEVTITVDDSDVDYTKNGEYRATVIAKDKSKNTEKKETTIKVVDPTITLDKTSETIYVKADTFFKATINGKEQTATWTSADSSVATVNAEGKVTGVKAGTTTITAQANGVSVQASVTVKSVPSGSKTTQKTVTNPTTGKQETVTVVEQSKPSSSGNSGSSASASVSMEAFNYINQERQKMGLSPCQYDSRIGNACIVRAKELATKFSHTRPNGKTCGTALTEAGYPTKGNGVAVYEFQECIGMNYSSSYSIVYNGWKNSSGHWNALMDSSNKYMAVARYGNYWVAMVIDY